MKYYEEFLKLEVFNFEEAQNIVGSKENAKVILNLYVKKGLIKRVRRNLYCTVNLENRKAAADRYLIASKINKKSYLAYHSAFEVHGLSHQVSFIVYVVSDEKISDFEFEGVLYKYVGKGINEGITHYGLNNKIMLTDLERTVIDCLDRLDYCGGVNEFDEILKICRILDESKLEKYLEIYDKQILYKKAGYFLERYQQSLGITDCFLSQLEKRTGKGKSYLDEGAQNGNGVLIKRWGLIVPKSLEAKGDIFV